MEPIPTSFHVGALVFHTYGLGLALAAYVAYRYGESRFRHLGLSVAPFAPFAIWILVAALVGARAAHVATNWSYYGPDPIRVFAVWQGGLASFGGIALAAPVGCVLARRWWPDTPILAFTDALLPVLVAGWALGRVLGPNFEIAGGGHLTHQWFGLDYAGQVGKRVPVPIIQSLEDGALFGLLIWRERRFPARQIAGLTSGIACVVWGLVRTTDEHLLLGAGTNAGSTGVEIAGLVLAVIGAAILLHAHRHRAPPVPN